MLVREIMSRSPHTVELTETVGQLMRRFEEADVRHLPVVDRGSLVGIISDRDLRSIAPSALGAFEHPAETENVLALPVSRIMSSDVISVNPEEEVAEVIDLMIERRIGAIPVVEADSDRLIGIVSYVDALRAARDLL